MQLSITNQPPLAERSFLTSDYYTRVPADLPRVKCKPFKADGWDNAKIRNYAASGVLARDFDLISNHSLSAHVIILLCSFSTFDFSFIKT